MVQARLNTGNSYAAIAVFLYIYNIIDDALQHLPSVCFLSVRCNDIFSQKSSVNNMHLAGNTWLHLEQVGHLGS